MNELFIYLLKASAGIILFSLPYYLFLRKEPNLAWKRYYLVFGIIASFIVPFLEFNLSRAPLESLPVFFIDISHPDKLNSVDIHKTVSNTSTSFTINNLMFILYITGLITMLFRSMISLLYWKKIRKSSQSADKRLLYSERNEVFSFFKFIHLPNTHKKSIERSSLLYHEQAHIRQLHFLDLLVAEASIILTWFNPFTWLITRMIKENHEHLADREVLSRGINPAHYRAHLLNQTLGVPVFSFGQSFNHSLTKKRFEMMKTKKSKRSGLVKMLAILPIILFSMSLLSLSNNREGEVTGKVSFADTGETAAGVSIVIKNTTKGTVSDIDGNFGLLVSGKSQLVLSFVGYQTKVVDVNPGDKLKLQLEPKVYEIEMDHMPVSSITPTEWTVKSGEEILFIVDGQKVDDIENLEAEDIESINVIKDRTQIAAMYPEYKGYKALIKVITIKNAQKKVKKEETGEELFVIVEDMPEFPGGLDELRKHIYLKLKYPEKAKQQGKEGEVMVKFNVNTRGEVESPEIIQTTDPVFNASALEVFKDMPLWKPGKQRGKPVKVSFTVPVYFKLPAGN